MSKSDEAISSVTVHDLDDSVMRPRSLEQGPVGLNGPPDLLPLWFERGLVIAIAAVVFFGAFGLLMAVLGLYNVLPVFVVGGVGTFLASLLAWPKRKATGHAPRGVRFSAIGMCIVSLGFLVWNGVDDGHYVAIDRDPGIYAAAGKWIASNGSLEVQAGKAWTAKGTEFNWASAGMYPEGDGRLEFQFNPKAAVETPITRRSATLARRNTGRRTISRHERRDAPAGRLKRLLIMATVQPIPVRRATCRHPVRPTGLGSPWSRPRRSALTSTPPA